MNQFATSSILPEGDLLTAVGGSISLSADERTHFAVIRPAEAGSPGTLNVIIVQSSSAPPSLLTSIRSKVSNAGLISSALIKVAPNQVAALYGGALDRVSRQSTELEQLINLFVTAVTSDAEEIILVLTRNGQDAAYQFCIADELTDPKPLDRRTASTWRNLLWNAICDQKFGSLDEISNPTATASHSQLMKHAHGDQTRAAFKKLEAIRCQFFSEADALSVVIRLVRSDWAQSIDQLGLHPDHLAIWLEAIHWRSAVMWLTGQTGSGKTVTLAAVMRAIQEHYGWRKHQYMVEDPPEIPIKGARRLVANEDADPALRLGFAERLREVLRGRPHKVMVGETRNQSTGSMVYRTGVSGIWVVGSIHSDEPLQIPRRLTNDLGVDPGLVYDRRLTRLLGGQALLPRLCPDCRVPLVDIRRRNHRDVARIERAIEAYAPAIAAELDRNKIFVRGAHGTVEQSSSEPCATCGGTGTVRRELVAEMVLTDARVLELIAAGPGQAQELYQYVESRSDVPASKMRLLDHAWEKANAGLIDPLDAASIAPVPFWRTPRAPFIATSKVG